MNQERLMSLILAPHVSEKATNVTGYGQYVFKVAPKATKAEIKAAIESIYKVAVASVHVLNNKGKNKRFQQFQGRRKNTKKAYVSLADGHSIDVFDDVKKVGDN